MRSSGLKLSLGGISTALLLILSWGILHGPMGVSKAVAQEQEAGAEDSVFVTDKWRIRRGGRIYGNWADELGGELPETTHPSYPASGKKSGQTTWRCKECHGWDYKGKDGAYGSGSHFTGIGGIQDVRGALPVQIAKILRDNTHRYTAEMIPDKEIENLAYFLSWGQIDMDIVIDPETKRVRGDVGHGAEIFQTVCAVCHGLDGKEINFGDAGEPEYIGTIGEENPWEMLHNVRFGHSGDAMVGLIAFPLQDQADVVSYTRTLPSK